MMLYCPKCQLLTESDAGRCPACGSKKLRGPQPGDPVLLMTADETKAEMIEAVFDDNGVPYEERVCGLGGPPRQYFGKTMCTNKNIFVPFGKLNECRELVHGIGIADASDAELLKQDKETDGGPELEEMSAKKRFLWRAFSAILFILIVWGVVAASDFIATALKALFTNS